MRCPGDNQSDRTVRTSNAEIAENESSGAGLVDLPRFTWGLDAEIRKDDLVVTIYLV